MSLRPEAPCQGESFALADGLRRTSSALARWRADPAVVLVPWFAGAAAIAATLLASVWVVSLLVPPDPTRYGLPGVAGTTKVSDAAGILSRNLLVLALHATACVAGFIAGSSLRHVAAAKRGLSRIVHERAGPVAIAWVVAVTCFSLLTQALALGFNAASLASQLHVNSALLIATVLPHALLELVAVFLPLAAWLIASRRNEWHDLLAATFVTVAIAIPMVLAAAAIEITWWPWLLERVSPVALDRWAQ